MTIQPNQVLELIWIGWLISWIAASFWSARAQKRAATLEIWTYRAAMIAGGILLVPWTSPMLGEKPIWEVSYGGAVALAAVMLAGLSRGYQDRMVKRISGRARIPVPTLWCATRSTRASSLRCLRQRPRGKSDGANRRGIRHLRRLAEGAHGGALLDG